MVLGKLLNFFWPQFPHPYNGDNYTDFLGQLRVLNKRVHIKQLIYSGDLANATIIFFLLMKRHTRQQSVCEKKEIPFFFCFDLNKCKP